MMYMQNTWNEQNNMLAKTFVFSNFKEALAFVNNVGEVAEGMQHHPNIAIQNYKEVVITTTTHDAENKVTEKDRELTEKIDALGQFFTFASFKMFAILARV